MTLYRRVTKRAQEFLYLEVDDSDKEFEETSRQHVIHVKRYQNLLLPLLKINVGEKFEQFKRKTQEEFEELSKNVTKNRPVQCPPREHVNKFLQLVKARFDCFKQFC